MYAQHEHTDLGQTLSDCETVDLEETNRLARMLIRTDCKYLVDFGQFESLAELVKDEYYVLQIDSIKQFSYSSCYYDDEFACYFEHHQARRQRFKVRTREYLDSGLKFFEVKLKGRRGITRKHRINCEQVVMPRIGGEHFDLLSQLYADQYHKPMRFALSPALVVNYKRCTLVSRQGGERVTIDHELSFDSLRNGVEPVRLNSDFIIVETKSRDGKGITDQALKRLRVRKASKCSKYCIGVNLTGAVRKNNNFLHTIKQARKSIITSPVLPQVVAA